MKVRVADYIDNYFQISARSSTIPQEIRSGITTFLTLSYILLVNPQVLSKVGIPATDIVIATALSSAVASWICGIFGNLPFGLAPGIGLSTYLVYGLVIGEGYTRSQAYLSSFIAGVLLCLLAACGLANIIMSWIPRSVKLSTIVGMGLQIAVVGMTSVNMIVANPQTIVGLGDMTNYKIMLTMIGLIMIGSLLFHQIPGGILIGIVVLTLATWIIEDSFPTKYIELPQLELSPHEFLNISEINLPKMFPAIIACLFIGIVDVGGVTFGMSSLANITEPSGRVPGSLFAFLACGIGSMVGASCGSTSVIVYVESAAGIKEGGRTGLTAITIGALFFLSLFLAPVFSQVPTTATAPVSILVGAMMMSQAAEIDWNDMSEAIPAFLCLIIMPFTFSITNGIMFGLGAAILFYITTGKIFDSLRTGSYVPVEEEPYFPKVSSVGDIIVRSQSTGSLDNRDVASFKFNYGNTVVRTPSLVLSKMDADSVRIAEGMSVQSTTPRTSPRSVHSSSSPRSFSMMDYRQNHMGYQQNSDL